MSISEFNDITPRELFLIVDDYNEKRQQYKEDYITQAHLIATWHRVKTMPKLDVVLESIKPKNTENKEQTPEQMMNEIKRLMKG